MTTGKMGVSGRIAQVFVQSEITALLLIAALLSGVFAVLLTPREEEPQINVTFANVFIPFPGADAREVENLVTTPAEQVISEIGGIEHIYSTSSTGMATLTVQFEVGEDRTEAVLNLYDKIFSNLDWLPQNLGVGSPIIKPRSIDDIPIVTATLWSTNPERTTGELLKIARTLETELKRVPGTRQVRTIGGADEIVDVRIDPQRLAGHGLALSDLKQALQVANASAEIDGLVNDNQQIPVRAGTFLTSAEDVDQLVVGMYNGQPVYLNDVAEVNARAETPNSYVTHVAGAATGQGNNRYPAVTLAVAKQPGTNAVDISNEVIDRLDALKGIVIPHDVESTITRDYGATADSKARKLISKLLFATGSVVILVVLTMGWRPAVVVGIAVVATLAATLMASLAYGFTINRVSLFALIFSIGILVDDAIVVVENIHRHLSMGDRRSLWQLIPEAVDEVGGPTILATFTVIAALLPMAFVTGLMGPYMSPIPINASMGMLISLLIAFIISPWLAGKLLPRHNASDTATHENSAITSSKSYRFFNNLVGPFLRRRSLRYLLVLALLLTVVLAASLTAVRLVVLKMLPFDNKSEFQVVVDLPEGSSLETMARLLEDIGGELDQVAEIEHYQMYAGTSAPVGFNGLVRQYYLRQASNFGDIQVNLVDQHDRQRKSHDIAREVREQLAQNILHKDATIKVVEVPPGPPVLSPLVAEIYGPDYREQIDTAQRIRTVFEGTKDIVDIDDTINAATIRYVVAVDRQRAATLGVSQADVTNAIRTSLDGDDVGYLHSTQARFPVPIRLQLMAGEQVELERLLAVKVRSRNGHLVSLRDVTDIREATRERTIHHKDLLPVVYVLGDMAGPLDSPLYGMADIYSALNETTADDAVEQYLVRQPPSQIRTALKWDGEWQITYTTFRDMGIAYSVGIILIYFLVVAQFRSYLIPLIIMAPIPLTVIGVMPGHALLGAQFTATSMIGMIALAGIIVRNSILLVEFINQQIEQGAELYEAVVSSSAVRAKPIILTGAAAMIGAFFILDDPIFNGLAVALIFGIFVSTLLTLIVIPVLYYAYLRRRMSRHTTAAA